jgi:hypothetical protein
MKKRILFCLLLTFPAFSSILQAQEEKYPETVMIRVFESFGTSIRTTDNRIFTITPDNRSETKILKRVNLLLEEPDAELIENQIQIKIEIQRWRNAGFHVVSTSTSITELLNLHITTIILEKD